MMAGNLKMTDAPNIIKTFHYGCRNRAGHYLTGPRWASVNQPTLERFDGLLAPITTPRELQGPVQAWRLWHIGYSAISWWDRTIDKRMGSNNIIFTGSMAITPEEMMAAARNIFTEVYRRVPNLELLPGIREIKTEDDHKRLVKEGG